MPTFVPFVFTPTDLELMREFYPDCPTFRIPLRALPRLSLTPAEAKKAWIDAEVDVYWRFLQLDDPKTAPRSKKKGLIPRWWERSTTIIDPFAHRDLLRDKEYVAHPTKQKRVVLEGFVNSVLSLCYQSRPFSASIPQLPYSSSKDHHEINRRLAKATGRWRSRESGREAFKLILPVVFTSRSQYRRQTERRRHVRTIENCAKAARAAAVWVVDEDLNDQKGVENYRHRFSELILFHQELRGQLPDLKVIAGPYWGFNILVWARQLAHLVAVGLRTRYQYYISGGQGSYPQVRLPLAPLRRWALVGGKALKKWLDDALGVLSKGDEAYQEFRRLLDNYNKLSTPDAAVLELTRFYRSWMDELESVAPTGRKLSLFQALTAAYVLGSTLDELPEKSRSRIPGIVAEQLMLNCLSNESARSARHSGSE